MLLFKGLKTFLAQVLKKKKSSKKSFIKDLKDNFSLGIEVPQVSFLLTKVSIMPLDEHQNQ